MAHEVRGKPLGKTSSGYFDGEVVSLFFFGVGGLDSYVVEKKGQLGFPPNMNMVKKTWSD